ncbi:hypothetical protein BDW67DRAFT_179635 [Aspergillus spinulosporus]
MPPRALFVPPNRPVQPPEPSQARKKRPAQDTLYEGDSAFGILCRVPCLRCAKQSWVMGPGNEPEQEIVKIRGRQGDDTDRVADTVNWTRRVETFLRKANREPEMLRLMRSLLRHTFELRNDLRAAHRHALAAALCGDGVADYGRHRDRRSDRGEAGRGRTTRFWWL